MSAASLLMARLGSDAVGVADRISPDLRPATGILPCVIYHIDSDQPLPALLVSPLRYLAHLSLTLMAPTLAECFTLQAAVVARVHGQTWTSSTSTAYSCVIRDSSSGLVDDPDAGTPDLDRTLTLTLELYHS